MIKSRLNIGVLAIVTLLLLSGCGNDSTKKANTTPEKTVKETLDTGVGPNGIAKTSSPSFVAEGGEVVTMENIVRAETAKYFAEEIIKNGANKFRHERNGIQLDNQTIIRSNFDLIYSYAVYDISGGLKVSIPAYDLYQTIQVFDENHVTIAVVYPGETVELSKDDVTYGQHVYLFMRTQPRTLNEVGMEEMRERQDIVSVEASSAKPYISKIKYDVESFNTMRNDLIKRAVTEGVIHRGFIDDIKNIDPPHYQMINLAGWGGLPAKHAFYFIVLPSDEGAKAGKHSSVTFNAPDLQYDRSGYWSITIYDEKGWVVTENFFTNSSKAIKNEDGTITLNFNGTKEDVNNIDVPENWNALFRCYLPSSVESIVSYKDNFVKTNKVLEVK